METDYNEENFNFEDEPEIVTNDFEMELIEVHNSDNIVYFNKSDGTFETLTVATPEIAKQIVELIQTNNAN